MVFDEAGKKVVLVDADPQANATSGIGFEPKNIQTSIYECIIDDLDINNVILRTGTPNLDLVPAHIDLVGAEVEIINLANREKMMRKVIQKIKDKYEKELKLTVNYPSANTIAL